MFHSTNNEHARGGFVPNKPRDHERNDAPKRQALFDGSIGLWKLGI